MKKTKGIVSLFKRSIKHPAAGVRLAGLRKAISVAGKILLLSPFELTRQKRRSLVITIEKGWAMACILKGTPSRYVVVKKNLFKGLDNQYPSPEELGYFIGMITEGMPVKKMNIILTVPKEWCVVKANQFPAVVLDNLSSVIAFEMDNLTPFSADEVYYDYDIIKRDGQTVSVAIYTVRKQMVDPYLYGFQKCGYKVSSLTLNPLSLVRACLYSKRQIKDASRKDVLVINFMQGKTELIAAENGVLTSVYAFKSDDVDGVLSYVKDKVSDNTLIFINNDPTIDTSVEEISAMLPSSAINMDTLSLPVKDSAAYDLRLPLGAAMGVGQKARKAINLLSFGKVIEKRLPVVVTLLLLLLFIPLAIFHIHIPIWKDEQALVELDKQIKVLKPEVDKVENIKKEIKAMEDDLTVLNKFNNKRRLVSEMLKELTVILPNDTWLARLTITDKDIMIEGYAPTATLLLSILDNSKYFKDVATTATTYKDTRLAKERFQIKAAFK
ncbi:MAG: pilus assembly protein PilM [Nitrospirae bacterium]|nr:pilus assembly protein PilM [Nitrospirota bacterium]